MKSSDLFVCFLLILWNDLYIALETAPTPNDAIEFHLTEIQFHMSKRIFIQLKFNFIDKRMREK